MMSAPPNARENADLEATNKRNNSIVQFWAQRSNRCPEGRQALADSHILASTRSDVVDDGEGIAVLRVKSRGIVVAEQASRLIPEQFVIRCFDSGSISRVSSSEIRIVQSLRECGRRNEVLRISRQCFRAVYPDNVTLYNKALAAELCPTPPSRPQSLEKLCGTFMRPVLSTWLCRKLSAKV